jgi:hypothetical protein
LTISHYGHITLNIHSWVYIASYNPLGYLPKYPLISSPRYITLFISTIDHRKAKTKGCEISRFSFLFTIYKYLGNPWKIIHFSKVISSSIQKGENKKDVKITIIEPYTWHTTYRHTNEVFGPLKNPTLIQKFYVIGLECLGMPTLSS